MKEEKIESHGMLSPKKSSYLKPSSAIHLMDLEGVIAASGEGYGDGGGIIPPDRPSSVSDTYEEE